MVSEQTCCFAFYVLFTSYPQTFARHAANGSGVRVGPFQHFLFPQCARSVQTMLFEQLQKRSQHPRLLGRPAVQCVQGIGQSRLFLKLIWQLERAFGFGFIPFLPFLLGYNQLGFDQLVHPTLRMFQIQHIRGL